MSVHVVFSTAADEKLFRAGMERLGEGPPADAWVSVVADVPGDIHGNQGISAWKKWYGIAHLLDLQNHNLLYGMMMDSEILPFNTTDCGRASAWHGFLQRLTAREGSKVFLAARVGTSIKYRFTDKDIQTGREYDRDLILASASFVTHDTWDHCIAAGCKQVQEQVNNVLFSWWTDVPYVKLRVVMRMLLAMARSWGSITAAAAGSAALHSGWKALVRRMRFPPFEHLAYQQWCLLHEGFRIRDVTNLTGEAKWGSYLEDPPDGARIGELEPLWVSAETYVRAERAVIPPLSRAQPPLLVFHVDHEGDRFGTQAWEQRWRRATAMAAQPLPAATVAEALRRGSTAV